MRFGDVFLGHFRSCGCECAVRRQREHKGFAGCPTIIVFIYHGSRVDIVVLLETVAIVSVEHESTGNC